MPILVPYVVGVVTAPLAAKIISSIFRGTVKTTVGLALQVKKAAAEVGEEIQDISAEAKTEHFAAEAQPVVVNAPRVAAQTATTVPNVAAPTVTVTTPKRG